MDVFGLDIDEIEEIVVHEIGIALLMRRGKTDILVQIHASHSGKVHVALVVPLNELPVRADGRAARGQTQHGIRPEDHLRRNDVGNLTACLLIVFCFD